MADRVSGDAVDMLKALGQLEWELCFAREASEQVLVGQVVRWGRQPLDHYD